MHLDFFEPCSRLDVAVLKANRPMTNIAQILLSGEGYLADAMRYAGADEKYITGGCSDFERFRELCRVYPFFEGNVAQYVCREILSLIFGIEEELSEKNCEEIWTKTADLLVKDPLTPTDLLKRLNISEMGILTDICADLSAFETLGTAAPVLCPDSVLSVGKRGYKKIFSDFERACGEEIRTVSAFDAALERLTEKFVQNGCSLAVVGGLSADDFGKNDYYHAESALTRAISTDGNVSDGEKRDFCRYAVGKFLEICRRKRLDVMLEFYAPPLEILPDIKVKSPVERRIRLNFSESETPLAKDCLIDLRSDLQERFSAYARRYAIGNMPPFFVGSANLCELCLHGFYRDELENLAKKL